MVSYLPLSLLTLFVLSSPLCLAVMWLWAARRGHLAICVSGQLCHFLTLIPLTVSCQHGNHYRCHCHGNGLFWLPGCHQGEQVPASERELSTNLHSTAL